MRAARKAALQLFRDGAEVGAVEKLSGANLSEAVEIGAHPTLGPIHITRLARNNAAADYSTLGKLGDTRRGRAHLLAVPLLREIVATATVGTRGSGTAWRPSRFEADPARAARKAAEGVEAVAYLDAVVDIGGRPMALQLHIQRRMVGRGADGQPILRNVLYALREHRAEEARALIAPTVAADPAPALGRLEALRAAVDSEAAGEIARQDQARRAAPALWADRENPKETPPDFITRVYPDRLAEGLTRGDLDVIDRKLHRALLAHERRFGAMAELRDTSQALAQRARRLRDQTPEQLATRVAARQPAPELYKERADKTETAPAFIARVYAGRPMRRADLKDVDPGAFNALVGWERKTGERVDLQALLGAPETAEASAQTDAAEATGPGAAPQDLAQFVRADSAAVDIAMLRLAQKMAETGRDPLTGEALPADAVARRDQIFLRTGLFLNEDGILDAEIDDSGMTISPAILELARRPEGVSGALGDLVRFDALLSLARYKVLAHAPLTLRLVDEATLTEDGLERRGAVDDTGVAVAETDAQLLRESLAHELSHLIRDVEGRESGTNEIHMGQMLAEARRRRMERALELAATQTLGAPVKARLAKAGLPTDPAAVAEAILELFYRAPVGSGEAQALITLFGDPSVQEAFQLVELRDGDVLYSADGAVLAYMAQLGEQIAELVEARIAMTPEERAATPPRFPSEERLGVRPITGLTRMAPLPWLEGLQEAASRAALEADLGPEGSSDLTQPAPRRLTPEEIEDVVTAWRFVRETEALPDAIRTEISGRPVYREADRELAETRAAARAMAEELKRDYGIETRAHRSEAKLRERLGEIEIAQSGSREGDGAAAGAPDATAQAGGEARLNARQWEAHDAVTLAGDLLLLEDFPDLSPAQKREVVAALMGIGASDLLQQEDAAGDIRGAMTPTFDERGLLESALIKFTEKKNLSTFVHEVGGHLMFEIYRWAAAQDNAPQDVKRDVALTMQWLGVKDPSIFDALTNRPNAPEAYQERHRQARAAHEKWARAFEAYLMEGRAPTPKLQGTFAKLAMALRWIYSGVREILLQRRPWTQNDVDIRPIMDRMHATEAEILEARDKSGAHPLIARPGDLGMSETEFEIYRREVEKSEEAALARALSMALNQLGNERDAIFKQRVEEEMAAAEKRVKERRVWRAFSFLTRKGAPRIDETSLREAFPDFDPTNLAKAGNRRVYAPPSRAESDVDAAGDALVSVEEAAAMFGYTPARGGAEQMIRDLSQWAGLKTETLREARRAALAAMKPVDDLFTSGKIEDAAQRALHEEAQQRVVEMEIQALAKGADAVGVNRRNARAIAAEQIAEMRLEDAARPQAFLAAERRAARNAATVAAQQTAQAKKNARPGAMVALFEKMLRFKEQQLLAMAMWRQSMEVDAEVKAFKRRVERLKKQITRMRSGKLSDMKKNTVAGDYLAQIENLLHTYEFVNISKTRRRERVGYAAWRQQMIDAGREQELADPAPAIENEVGRRNFKDLTVDEFRSLVELVRNLEHLGRLKDDLKSKRRGRELERNVAALSQQIQARPTPRRTKTDGAKTWGERMRGLAASGFMHLMEASTIVQAQIDEGEAGGKGWELLIAPISRAYRRLTPMMQDAAAKWNAVNAVYSEKEWTQMGKTRAVPGAVMPDGRPVTMSHADRLALGLNWGNAGNRDALLRSKRYEGAERVPADNWLPQVSGESVTMPAPIKAILDSLDARDWAYIQSVWDLIDSYRAEIAAKEKRLTGVAPEFIQAAPVATRFGALKGGYYPLRYGDGLTYGTFEADPASQGDLLSPENASRRGKAGTKRSFMRQRVGSNERNVLLDLSVMYQHVNAVVYDLAMGEAVADVSAILSSRAFAETMEAAGREAGLVELQKWLRDIGDGEIAAGDFWSRMLRMGRANLTYGALAFSTTSAAVQPTGILQSWATLGLGKSDMIVGLAQAANALARKLTGRHNLIDQAYEDSPLLRERMVAINKEVADAQKQMRWNVLTPVMGPRAAAQVVEAGYLFIQLMQRLVDVPTYLAAYRQGMRKFGDKRKAIDFAEDILQRSQGGQDMSRRSAFERGSIGSFEAGTKQTEFVKAFSLLQTYWNLKKRLMYLKGAEITHARGVGGKAVATADFLGTGLLIYSVEALIGAMIYETLRGDDWWEEREDADEDPAAAIAWMTLYTMMQSFPGLNWLASERQGFRGGTTFALSVKNFEKLWAQLEQGDVDIPLMKAAVKGVSLFTPIPASQLNRTGEALAVSAEQDVEWYEYLFGLDRDPD